MAIIGAIDAVFAPRMLKKLWEQQDRDKMKRFWKYAETVERDEGWGVELDAKPLRTPARKPLVVPTEALAEAIAAEWESVVDKIDPRAMPLTGLANAAIDRVAPDKQAFAAGLARLRGGGPRLLPGGRAERPDRSAGRALGCVARLGRRRFDVDFDTTSGIIHVDQPRGDSRAAARMRSRRSMRSALPACRRW